MKKEQLIPDIEKALDDRSHSTITQWQQLLGSPRSENFDRALKAEIRDPLWMLTRQWQLGEFQGDDAGSPIFAQIEVETTRLNKYRPRNHQVEPFNPDIPLETTVECRPIPFLMNNQPISLDIRLLMGRQWFKLLRKYNLSKYSQRFRELYKIERPDPSNKDSAYICAHADAWQTVSAVAGRSMDGWKLYAYLTENREHHPYDGIDDVPSADKERLDQVADSFKTWFKLLYHQPSEATVDVWEDAWDPARLEYQFSCFTSLNNGEASLTAEEYYHGHLDWYNFNWDWHNIDLFDPQATVFEPVDQLSENYLTENNETASSSIRIPTPIAFDGMPNTRWWTFEDSTTNFGNIDPDTTDLAKLLLIEFGLVYANDWFLLPYSLPTGSLAQIKGIVVTNVFGERYWIDAAENSQKNWEMFTLQTNQDELNSPLMLLPTAESIQEGKPIEDVVLIRDEVANMVWGVERQIPLVTGIPKPGNEAALQTRNFYQYMSGDRSLEDDSQDDIENDEEELLNTQASLADIRYQLMTQVPENWIPFIPVHLDDNDNHREIQLQRAAMPRIVAGDSELPVKVRPRTTLLRQGLDQFSPSPYFLHEEEVPRGGVRVTQSFQRTRWNDGKVFVWLGTQKETGWGEGSSGLLFDQLIHVEKT